MRKWKACAFSSTRKESRPKKWTTPPIACSMCCQADGGCGGRFSAPSNGGAAGNRKLVNDLLLRAAKMLTRVKARKSYARLQSGRARTCQLLSLKSWLSQDSSGVLGTGKLELLGVHVG